MVKSSKSELPKALFFNLDMLNGLLKEKLLSYSFTRKCKILFVQCCVYFKTYKEKKVIANSVMINGQKALFEKIHNLIDSS